ncbi:MAG: response regulator transcription factor [Bacillota bacterium]
MPHILVVDDDKEIAGLVEIYLTNEGCRVTKATAGWEALEILKNHPVQLLILDIMMPGMDGLEVCRRLRREKNIPIIMLSAKSEEMDKILGLGTGADDYVTKPFHPMELVARVKSQLRRYLYLNTQPLDSAPGEQLVRVKGLTMNQATREVNVFKQPVSLTPTEFDILYLLASHPRRVFSAEEIFEKVWKEKYYESQNTVMVHIRRIREKLKHAGEEQFIKTVWGVGYKVEN